MAELGEFLFLLILLAIGLVVVGGGGVLASMLIQAAGEFEGDAEYKKSMISMSKVFLTLFAFAGLLQTGCAREERMIPMISTADPVLLREVSNAELRANLTLARAGNREAMSILVSYYLNNDMPKQAEYWGDLHDKAVKLGQ